MYNIHIRIYTYFCGTRSDRKLKAYINHLLNINHLHLLLKKMKHLMIMNYVMKSCAKLCSFIIFTVFLCCLLAINTVLCFVPNTLLYLYLDVWYVPAGLYL